MEGPVNGIRGVFCRDLTEDYLEDPKKSFLYRAFWSESMTGLLKTNFSQLLGEEAPVPEDARQLRDQMAEAMRERPKWAKSLLLREPGWKKRRDIWEELWLNDAGYCARIITDTEYYLWLVEYLAEHDVYKTNIYYYDEDREKKKHEPHQWLSVLLQVGLGMEPDELKETAHKQDRRKMDQAGARLSKTEVEVALALLAEQIRDDRGKIASRLHKVPYIVKTKGGRKKADYLLFLTQRLKWLALHIKIKNWLQDSGYPLVGDDRVVENKKARKTDFTMRLFEAYCDSAKGYEFRRKTGDSELRRRTGGSGSWRLDGRGFCVPDVDADPEQLKAFLEARAAERDEAPYLYLPLAVHLGSGCVFFLAGKGNYEEAYQEADAKALAAYKGARSRYCFDYLRLTEDHSEMFPGGGAFCLRPVFHENAEASYKKVLDEFKGYCVNRSDDGPLHAVMEYNGTEPKDIPKAFRWAFDI